MKGSENFAYSCLFTMIKFAKNPDKLNIYLGVDMNQERATEKNIRLKKIKELVPDINIEIITTGYRRSSLSHSIILNKLYEKFKNKYGIIMDNDVIFLKKNWDDILIQKMRLDELTITGMPYDDGHHYQKFPSATFIFFDRTKLSPLNIDFRPPNWKFDVPPPTEKISSVAMSKLYGLPIGKQIRHDTGGELCPKIKNSGLSYYTFKISNFINKSAFLCDNDLIISHHDGGSKTKNYKSTKLWIDELIKHAMKYDVDLSTLDNLYGKNGWFD
jgi:hypothetical protein